MKKVYNRRRIVAAVLLLLMFGWALTITIGCSKTSIDTPNSSEESFEYISEEQSEESIDDSSVIEPESSEEPLPPLADFEEEVDVLGTPDYLTITVKIYDDFSPDFNKDDGVAYLDDIASFLLKYAPEGMPISAATAMAYTEGGSGKKGVYTVTNNCFGLRASSTWDGYVFARSTGKVYKDYKTATKYKAYDLFRAYDSMEESVMDYVEVIKTRYSGALETTTPKSYLKYLLSRGYGTTDILSTWMYVISLYDLTQYDNIELPPLEYPSESILSSQETTSQA